MDRETSSSEPSVKLKIESESTSSFSRSKPKSDKDVTKLHQPRRIKKILPLNSRNLRKMSIMPEENDDTSTDTEPSNDYRATSLQDSDSPIEESARLLISHKIKISPSTSVSADESYRENSPNRKRQLPTSQQFNRQYSYPQQHRYHHQDCHFSYNNRHHHQQQQPYHHQQILRTNQKHLTTSGARYPSMRSLKSSSASDEQHCYCMQNQQTHLEPPSAFSWSSVLYPESLSPTSTMLKTFPSDNDSVRSLASIGLGSSDGKKLTIKRVPTSPLELINMVQTQIPPDEDASTCGSFDNDDHDDYRQPKRPHWENKVQFVLACIGYSVGLGNVWRFPYLCYKSGGGVFLIPYFIVLIICGVPLLYMELSIGQFTRRGPIGALGQICPLFKGAGLSSVIISFLMSTYHNVIIAYAIYYFFTAMRPIHPWTGCDHRWNTLSCWSPDSETDNYTRPLNPQIPSAEFFDHKVLQISDGIEYPGELRWELAACLITAWVIVYFSIWKSIKSSARVRYLTATLPFVLIFVFLTRSLTLEGAEVGLQFFFRPDWELLKDSKVWVNAAAQIFNSVGIAFGSMICFASYNKFHNNIFIDTMAVSLINAFSCILVGIFAFATIGNIAVEQNMSVPEVLSDGPGLVFVVYPTALSKMPVSQLWATLFFFMLLCLSLNSQFAVVEVVVTSIQDGFPKWVRRNLWCHEVLVLFVCFVSFLFGLPNITQGGIYFFQLIDHYAASISIMLLAFFEVIAISWFYGVKRLSRNVKEMTGRAPSLYFRFCWLVAAPLLIFSLWVFVLYDYEPTHYTNHKGKYHYPWWSEAIGWAIASLSLVCIPAFAVYVFIRAEGTTFKEKLKNSIRPDFEACEVCGQEYCCEPGHSTEDEIMKEPLHESNNVQILPTYTKQT